MTMKLQIQDSTILQKQTVGSKSRGKIRGCNWRRKNNFKNGSFTPTTSVCNQAKRMD